MRHIMLVFVSTLVLAASGSALVACGEAVFKQESLATGDVVTLATYEDARKIFWHTVYPSGGETLYCGRPFLPSARRNFNIEHVFPMAWVSNALDCGKRNQCRQTSALFNRIEADMHNLFPARSDVNRARDSHRFGEIRGERRAFGKDCDFESDARRRVAEPRPAIRGDIARAMFYMADRYRDNGLRIFSKQASMLYQWHLDDPVSDIERKRNDRIEKSQGNRNRFIDKPEALSTIYNAWY